MSNQLQTQVKERSQKLAAFLDGKADDFKSVMVIEPERFLRMVKNAILRDPQIAEATTQSVFLECMKAAADGLVLDGREATLTRFKTNKRVKNTETGRWEDNYQTEVAYIPMVAGIMKRVRNSGEIKDWSVGLVYAKEYELGRFSYIAAPVAELRHEPIIVGERGEVVAAYSAVRLRDGSFHYEVMTKSQLDNIKQRTKSRKTIRGTNGEPDKEVITGPWATDEEEMYKKTVIRRHSKRLPVSSEVMDITQRIDALYDRDEDAYVLEEGPVPKPVANKRNGSAAERLRKIQEERDRQQRMAATDVDAEALDGDTGEGEETDHDAETGEILEGEVIEPETKPADKKKAAPAKAVDPEDEF